jgi:hypothetical protein
MSRIALIHAVQVAMGPIAAAFAELWPEARLVNILEDSLSPDRASEGELTPAMSRRIDALGDYAVACGAAGVLYTCSAFGPAIEAVARKHAVPVLKPNEAMFAEVLDGARSVGMVATFAPSIRSMEDEFAEAAMRAGSDATLRSVLAEGAMAALQRGDEATHNRLVAEAAATLDGCDVIMLAHFSTARALAETQARIAARVSTAPHAAVKLLRRSIDRDV